jgi:AraC-like DNA-binding protein
MQAQRSLMVTTLDPWASLPKVHQVAVAEARGAAYRFDVRERVDELALVQLCTSGIGRVWLSDGRELSVAPGDALCLRTRHDSVRYGLHASDRPWRFVYAELAGAAALAAMAEMTDRYGHVLRPADAAGLHRLLAGCADRAGTFRACWDSATSARTAMAILAAAMPRQVATQHELVERAIAWLDARLDGEVSVSAAAESLGVSREHLTRRMRAMLGEAPASWLRRRRLEMARDLLAAPDARVATVAARVGYRSVAQFTLAFRERFGASPAAATRL